MNKEIKSTLKKAAKIAGVTCITLGGAALIASGAALKALAEGARYLKDTAKKIIHEEPKENAVVEEAVAEEAAEAPAAEAVADEADVTEPESNEA